MDTRQTDTTSGNDERGVSPVIGVILMVAITVILAAVIATMVLDLGNVEGEVTAGVQVDNDTVTVTSLGDADGVYITNETGEVETNAVLTNTGASYQVTEDFESDDSFAIVAYQGDDAESADATTTIQTFDVEE